MKKTYDAPAVEIFNLVPDRAVASMNFSSLKDAALNGNGGNGAIATDSVSGMDSALQIPR